MAWRCLLMITAAMLSSCVDWTSIQCDEYKNVLRDDARSAQLLAWADAQIFSRTFKSSDFDPYAPAGPGRGGGNLDVEKIGLQMPELIKGYVVRSIGPDKFHPDVVLIGHRGSQGILMARGELMESLRGTTVDVSRLEERHRRLAMLCYVD
ncbi:MAG TPA: hypothetical protein VI238_00460 [Dokdonella sp.]